MGAMCTPDAVILPERSERKRAVPDDDVAALRRLADELFITTDLKDWAATRRLFADGQIEVDMNSLSHHLDANYRIEVAADRTLGATRFHTRSP